MNLELLAQVSQIVGAAVFVVVAILVWNRWIAPGVKAYQAAKNAELQEAEAHREQMRADLARAQAEVERADQDCKEIRARVGVVVRRERNAAEAAAGAESERIVRNAEGELERSRIAARDRLRIEFIEKALAKARQQAAGRVGDAENARLVGRTVDDLTRGRS
ncbi:MAG: hypothetical protein JOZ24_12860 [Candidatus Eremiobacteraeota bacterium]|nr:hypothetical protein [Candidatus Eremiobacteraeota bacterium]